MISADDSRNGITLEINNAVYRITEFQHAEPGKGAAFARTRTKNVMAGAVAERTFHPTGKFPAARIDRVEMQYLYADDDMYNFMNTETYDQISLNEDLIGDALKFVKEDKMIKVVSYDDNVFSVEPPLSMELEVTETKPGFAGNTATGAQKPATVETGAQISVPLFVDISDCVKIDTRTGEYLGRVQN